MISAEMTNEITDRGLILLTNSNRELSRHDRLVLTALCSDLGLNWREVPENSHEGRMLSLAAPATRPVLFDADRMFLAAGRFSQKRLRRLIGAVGP